MHVAVKFIVLIAALVLSGYAVYGQNTGAGIAAAGAFMSFAWIETNEIKLRAQEEKDA
jgi:Ni,Fe-hydrogenase I cytochrome b subunit